MLLDEDLGIELHGDFSPRPVPDLTGAEVDLFSLMVSRAAMMGWSSPASALPHRPRLWHPASAGIEPSDQGGGSILWAQVIQEDRPAADSALVVQPLMGCLIDCADRLGRFDLAEARIAAMVSSRVDIAEIYGAEWISASGPWIEVAVALEFVHVDGGTRPASRVDTSTARAAVLVQGVMDQLRVLPYVKIRQAERGLLCEVPSWSAEAVGWVAALVMAAVSNSGVAPEQRLRLSLSPRQRDV